MRPQTEPRLEGAELGAERQTEAWNFLPYRTLRF